VAGLELVTSSGDVLAISRGDRRFPGAVVNLGALGIVTQVTLDVRVYYEMRQDVYEDLEWDALSEHWDQITVAGDSVSVFHYFGDRVAQVWVKRQVPNDSDRASGAARGDLHGARRDLFGARPARAARHPVLGGDPANCTPQLGEPGPWSERLPHFRSGFTPSSGEEIQSELLLGRADVVAAVRAVRAHADEIRPLLLTCEIRTIAADALWLSPAYGRDTAGLHFTWRRRQADVERVTARIEATLAPFAPRPHWAKLFAAGAPALAPCYPRIDDFRALRAELDPRGAFVNDWLRHRVLDGA
jgi:xylitol oxidase